MVVVERGRGREKGGDEASGWMMNEELKKEHGTRVYVNTPPWAWFGITDTGWMGTWYTSRHINLYGAPGTLPD